MRTNPLFEIFEIYILSLSIILKLFLIFGQSEPNDSYKEDSYKKKSVFWSCQLNKRVKINKYETHEINEKLRSKLEDKTSSHQRIGVISAISLEYPG